MSMISAQIDELRELAGDGSMEWVTGPIRASVLRNAADTILELRGALQVASVDYRHLQAERDKLREDLAEAEADRLREEAADAPKCEACEAMLDCDECLRADSSQKERRRLSAENARLRSELDSVGTAAYLYGRGDINDENAKLRELLDYMTPIAWYAASERERDRMRELGIEVDA